MARPIKEGLDYFPHDVDLSNDEKIEAMEALYLNDGYSFYCKLLERIYRSGGKLKFEGKENIIILAKKCNVSIDLFEQMLKSAFVLDLFDKEAGKNGILTSSGIQERFSMVTGKRVKMREVRENKKVCGVVSAEQTPQQTEHKPLKVKETKENKSIIINTKLQEYVSKLPNVSTIKCQLTEEESNKLTNSYSKELIKEKLIAMENIPKVNKKYASVYFTLLSWCGKDKPKELNSLSKEEERKIAEEKWLQGSAR